MKRSVYISLFFAILLLFVSCAPDREIETGDEGENSAPVVSAKVPDYFLVNEALSINTDDSFDPDGVIVSMRVNWGDGSAEETGPVGDFEHVFTALGTFSIEFTATDNLGETSSQEYTLQVLDVKPPDCNSRLPKCTPGRECYADGYCYTMD